MSDSAPDNPPAPKSEMLLYVSEDGHTRIDCRFEGESLWLSQALIAELYGKDIRTISEHLTNLYNDGEIDPAATIRKFRIVRLEGTREVARVIEHYSLEAIIAVGFRVRSARGAQFRAWANTRLREYLVKGFVLDDERLKRPRGRDALIPDYFDELLERIRDIRASEARVYTRVRDILALAADYEVASKATTKFFQVIQNKLHFAATQKTAAEIVATRADHSQPNMGLTSWKNAPEGPVHKSDVVTAKNYLGKNEIDELNRIVTMWLDFAEDQAKRRRQIQMDDWTKKLDDFLAFNERDVLQGAGSISHADAKALAEAEYEQHAEERRKLAEAEGERDRIAALEAQVKTLTKE